MDWLCAQVSGPVVGPAAAAVGRLAAAARHYPPGGCGCIYRRHRDAPGFAVCEPAAAAALAGNVAEPAGPRRSTGELLLQPRLPYAGPRPVRAQLYRKGRILGRGLGRGGHDPHWHRALGQQPHAGTVSQGLAGRGTSVHFYEAVLAALAIVVWHFYTVIFYPDVYPTVTAWLTGVSVRKHPSLAHEPQLEAPAAAVAGKPKEEPDPKSVPTTTPSL